MPMRDLPELSTSAAAPPCTSALMETRALSYSQGKTPLIKNISLAIPEGKTTILLGPNGAGKSLLLRLLHGLLAPTAGEILWQGAPLSAEARRAQAMVSQSPILLRRSAAANLTFALSALGLSAAERRARTAEALDAARLSHLARTPARRLSGGEQQRLCLARALATRPRLLLLDEPTASLDPASTAAVEAQLAQARARGCTIVLITHDPGQARRLGDTIAFLAGGELVETGPLEQTLSAPRTPQFQAWLDGRLWL